MTKLYQKLSDLKNGLGWNHRHVVDIHNAIDFSRFNTLEEVQEYYMEYHSTDFNVLNDVSVVSLLTDLEYQGFEQNQIVAMVNARYGNCIDLIYCKEDNMYCLAIGAR